MNLSPNQLLNSLRYIGYGRRISPCLISNCLKEGKQDKLSSEKEGEVRKTCLKEER